jgi:hypothetical protein
MFEKEHQVNTRKIRIEASDHFGICVLWKDIYTAPSRSRLIVKRTQAGEGAIEPNISQRTISTENQRPLLRWAEDNAIAESM